MAPERGRLVRIFSKFAEGFEVRAGRPRSRGIRAAGTA